MKDTAEAFIKGVRSALGGMNLEHVIAIARMLIETRDGGRRVFVAGNGGSAAASSHLVNDLNEMPKRAGRAPIRALDLASNVAWLTATANDEGFERVFVSQLVNLAECGDLLLLISVSGNSPNLVAAARYASDRGMKRVGLLGCDGGALLGMLDESVWIPCPKGDYVTVESVHAAICHLLAVLVSA